MAATLISDRVGERIKSRAEVFIRAAGLSTEDVARFVWERVVQTGEVSDAGGGVGLQHTKRDSPERS